ncbi:hypothetical protein XENOCAPTIV_009247, partial [Xenoophorus captivus]
TTRQIKEGEHASREYHFVTKELFEYMVCNHRFVEYGESKGQLYGTSIDAIDEVLKRGRMCIIDIEPPVGSSKNPTCPRVLPFNRNGVNVVYLHLLMFLLCGAPGHVVVNDDLQDACMQLCSVIQQAQNEPQWIPVSWLHAED